MNTVLFYLSKREHVALAQDPVVVGISLDGLLGLGYQSYILAANTNPLSHTFNNIIGIFRCERRNLVFPMTVQNYLTRQ